MLKILIHLMIIMNKVLIKKFCAVLSLIVKVGILIIFLKKIKNMKIMIIIKM